MKPVAALPNGRTKKKGPHCSFKSKKEEEAISVRDKMSNNQVSAFFKCDSDLKTSQKFDMDRAGATHLDSLPSLLEIFDDPSLLPQNFALLG